MSELAVCALCGASVPVNTVEIHVAGTVCTACAARVEVEHHTTAHRKRRGLLLPAIVGLVMGVILGLHRGGDSTVAAVAGLAAIGAAAGIGVRLGFRALAAAVGPNELLGWLGGLVYGVAIAVVAWLVRSELFVALLLAVPAVVAAGLFPVLTPDENEGPTGPYPLPVDINGVGRAVHSMASTPQTTALALCGFFALIPVIGAVLGLIGGISAAKARANAVDTPRVAARAPKLPCPEEPPQSCPPETTSVTEATPLTFIVETECRTEAGVAHGPYSSTYPDGERRSVGTYCNGYKDLGWTTWRRDGSKLSEGRYERGSRVGRWLFWDEPLHHQSYQDYQGGRVVNEGLTTDGATLLAGYDTACQSGDQQACLHTAYMLGGRYGVPADDTRALELYRGACDSGLPMACTQLGVVLMNGEDPAAHPEAAALFARACDANNAEGCLSAAALARDAGEDEQARSFYERACQSGNGDACHQLADMLRDADLPEPEQRETRKRYYERACRAGVKASCDVLTAL